MEYIMTNQLKEWIRYNMYRRNKNFSDVGKEMTKRKTKGRHRQQVVDFVDGKSGKMPDLWDELLEWSGARVVIIPESKLANAIEVLKPILEDEMPANILKMVLEEGDV